MKKPKQPARPSRKGGTTERPSCKDCIIQGMIFKIGAAQSQLNFRTRTEVGGYSAAENTATLKITAIPSNPACPCKWDDRINVEFIRIHTGLANQTRRQLMRMPQLIQSRRARINQLPNHVTISGCELTVEISLINRDLRNGNIGGAQFNLKAVPTRIGARVRCNGKWRNLLIVITD